jgi:hypothetical protein
MICTAINLCIYCLIKSLQKFVFALIKVMTVVAIVANIFLVDAYCTVHSGKCFIGHIYSFPTILQDRKSV